MRAKSLTLYSLPYVVSVASLIVAAHEVAPSLLSLQALSGAGHQSETFFGQSVNRALKGDRLPIRRTAPDGNGKSPPRAPKETVIARL